jgi:hypothetical protein
MWNPPIALTLEEQKIAARTRKALKFFVFLRERRHELLDATFQDTLAATYSAEPGGKEPVEAGSWPSPPCCRPTVTWATGMPWSSR